MKEKITSLQLFSLVAHLSFGPTILETSALLAGIAKQDAWIAALITILFGALAIWIMLFLSSQHPGMTYIGMMRSILGRGLGLIPAVAFVLFCLEIGSNLLWTSRYFVVTAAMPETPLYAISLMFTVAIVIALLYGVEVFARASELFMYIAFGLLCLTMMLLLPNARIENLLPVFENGVTPVLKSSAFLLGYSTFPLIIMTMIYPARVNNGSQSKMAFLKGYVLAGFLIFAVTLMAILVFGSAVTAQLKYPTFALAKEINVGIILTRVEFLIAIAWIITLFFCNTLWVYAGVIGLSELLGLQDYRKIILPLGLILPAMSMVLLPNLQYGMNWVLFGATPFMALFGLVLPVLLLIIFLIKKWVFKSKICDQ